MGAGADDSGTVAVAAAAATESAEVREATARRFIDLALECDALRFGEFELKSGRLSPYFLNTGRFNSGRALAELGRCYAETIRAAGFDFDMLYGPAYKGIPLVASVAVAFFESGARDVPYAFNRKEAKDHGEGGTTVGAPLSGRVLIVDDVISAGTPRRARCARTGVCRWRRWRTRGSSFASSRRAPTSPPTHPRCEATSNATANADSFPEWTCRRGTWG